MREKVVVSLRCRASECARSVRSFCKRFFGLFLMIFFVGHKGGMARWGRLEEEGEEGESEGEEGGVQVSAVEILRDNTITVIILNRGGVALNISGKGIASDLRTPAQA